MINKKINIKKAFTFAEMIISLCIIATIAAMMMIRFKNVSPKESILNYKKAYTTLQQAVSQIANDAEAFPTGKFDEKAKLDTDGKITLDEHDNIDTETVKSDYFCKNLAKALNTLGTPSCSATGLNIVLSNGIELHNVAGQDFEGEDSDKYIKNHIDIIIDTNGKKGPNTTDPVEKRDRFRARIYVDGKITTDNSWSAENAMLTEGSRARSSKKICFKTLKDSTSESKEEKKSE